MTTERDYNVLLGPVITEKATLGSEHGQVTFRVAIDATKPEIRTAVENLFKEAKLRNKGNILYSRDIYGRTPLHCLCQNQVATVDMIELSGNKSEQQHL